LLKGNDAGSEPEYLVTIKTISLLLDDACTKFMEIHHAFEGDGVNDTKTTRTASP
jgi:hypothetical protein